MSDDLKLSLNSKGEKPGRNKFLTVMVLVLLAVGIVNIALHIRGDDQRGRGGNLSGRKLEKLALKLEKRNLALPAARAWIEYMEKNGLDRGESARIWYRIGKLYHQSGDYAEALNAYYRSESFSRLEDLEDEISRRVSECLESLGRFAAMRSELERRTAFAPADSAGGEEIVAEIGNWRISRSELDMLIESEIEFQISQLASNLSAEERKSQKEKLLDNVFREGNRAEWLQSFIARELLYREAVKEGLQKDNRVRQLIRNMERKVLAQQYLADKYQSRIQVTPQDLREYYNAHPDEFKEDEEQLEFQEVKGQVYMIVRSGREREVQSDILQQLRDKYDVVIHRSRLGGETSD